jgi:hypothetical protein
MKTAHQGRADDVRECVAALNEAIVRARDGGLVVKLEVIEQQTIMQEGTRPVAVVHLFLPI